MLRPHPRTPHLPQAGANHGFDKEEEKVVNLFPSIEWERVSKTVTLGDGVFIFLMSGRLLYASGKILSMRVSHENYFSVRGCFDIVPVFSEAGLSTPPPPPPPPCWLK